MINIKMIALIGLVSILSSCIDEEDNPIITLTSDRDNVIGSWMMTPDQVAKAIEIEEDLEGLESWEITFKDDGSFLEVFLYAGLEITNEGRWDLKGNKLTRTIDDERAELTIVVTDNLLTMTDETGAALIYTRKN